jgi:adenylylsulfate kinase-like enzyme
MPLPVILRKWRRQRAGEVKGFTGIDAPYEAPEDPEIVVRTAKQTAAESVDLILAELLPRLRLGTT